MSNYTDQQLLQIIEAGESTSIDFKGKMNWNHLTTSDRLELIKDIVAMANSKDGGKIIIGVNDKTHKIDGLSEIEMGSFDVTQLNDLIYKYAGPAFHCFVSKNINLKIVIITIPESKVLPVIWKKEYDKIRKGTIFVRAKANTEPLQDEYTLREIIDRATVKKGDYLLHMISEMLNQSPITAQVHLNEAALTQLDEITAHWDTGFYGLKVVPALPALDLGAPHEIRQRVESSSVDLRKTRVFPITPTPRRTSNIQDGILVQDDDYESYVVMKDGHLAWARQFYEDKAGIMEKGRSTLSFLGIIFTMVDIFQFLKRFFSQIEYRGAFKVSIELHKIEGRALYADGRIALFGDYISRPGVFVHEITVFPSELSVSADDLAVNATQSCLRVFNCNDIPDEVIRGWITKYLNGQI